MALILWIAAIGIAIIFLRKFVRSIALPESYFKDKENGEQQEDEDANHLSGNIIDLKYYHGGIEDEDILNSAN